MSPQLKRIGQFDPARDDVDAAEAHYTNVHFPFASRMFRLEAPLVSYYATNRARGEYDLAGGFEQRPTAWRFAFFKMDTSLLTSERQPAGFLPLKYQERLWLDHTKCLKNIRAVEVTEHTVLTRPANSRTTVKYVFVVERSNPSDDSRDRYRRLRRQQLGELLSPAPFGCREVILNVVDRQVLVEPMDEPGQRYADGYDYDPDRIGIEEFYFDSRESGDSFFRSEEAMGVFKSTEFRVSGYFVEERIGLDRHGDR